MLLGVPELAKRLDIAESRARALVASGRIRGLRVGGRWIIDDADAVDYRRASAGRPLTESGSWQFIEAVHDSSHIAALDLDPVERHRLHRRIARFKESTDPVTMMLSLLKHRADKVLLSANPSDLAGLLEDCRLRPSGVSHPVSGLLPGTELEAYAARYDLPAAGHGAQANVLIHAAAAIPDEIRAIVVAADLAERAGPREQQAALEILRRIQGR